MTRPLPPASPAPLAPLARSRVVIVGDASDPIGRAVALHLAERGHAVLATGVDTIAMNDLPRETAQGGIVEVGLPGAAVARALALFGRLDALVATAPTLPTDAFARGGPGSVIAPLGALLELLAQATPALDRGRIVLVEPPPAATVTAAVVRAAIEALAKPLRAELAGTGIDIVTVATEVGRVRAPMTATLSELVLKALLATKPKPRYQTKVGR